MLRFWGHKSRIRLSDWTELKASQKCSYMLLHTVSEIFSPLISFSWVSKYSALFKLNIYCGHWPSAQAWIALAATDAFTLGTLRGQEVWQRPTELNTEGSAQGASVVVIIWRSMRVSCYKQKDETFHLCRKSQFQMSSDEFRCHLCEGFIFSFFRLLQ